MMLLTAAARKGGSEVDLARHTRCAPPWSSSVVSEDVILLVGAGGRGCMVLQKRYQMVPSGQPLP